MTTPTERIIRVGHSPDPDDAFMFYGLASGKVKLEAFASSTFWRTSSR